MYTEVDERCLFGVLKPALRQDLITWHGFSAPEAGQILNWFDPANLAYLDRVDEWVRLLCKGCLTAAALPSPFTRRNVYGNRDIFHLHPRTVGAIHQVAKLVYKFHGVPRKETNMQEVATRLSEPLPIALDRSEIEGIRECLSGIRPCDLNEAKGRFGPGVTYEGFSSYEKWSRKGFIPDVPPSLYRVNSRDLWAPAGRLDMQITKIAEVPKSIKSNRIVSSEPAMGMFAQLAVNDHLVREIHREFAGHVSLHDQELHNKLLRSEKMCTLDLSDASDHVSCELVSLLLPQLWPVLATVRSSYSQFPDGSLVRLATFAPMGSGVCFSVMTTVILGMMEFLAKEYYAKHRVRLRYSVYGDDIILDIRLYDAAVDLLSRAGLLVNVSKSCCTLQFKESCGLELYQGIDITPVYIRDPLERCPAEKIELVCQTLSDRFFPETAKLIADTSKVATALRWNPKLQRSEVLVRCISAKQKLRTLEGADGLMRWFCVRTQGSTLGDRRPTGAVEEVWTRQACRYKASQDYPYLTHWLVTSGEIPRTTR